MTQKDRERLLERYEIEPDEIVKLCIGVQLEVPFEEENDTIRYNSDIEEKQASMADYESVDEIDE